MNILQEKFKEYTLILASQSPRRQALIKGLELSYEIRTKEDIDEVFPVELKNKDVAPYLSELKFNSFAPDLSNHEFLITADTTVCLGNEVINKPKDRDDAIAMLEKLSGNMHTVVTGMSIGTCRKKHVFTAETDVYFKKLSSDEIIYYIDNFKPFDKAGAYGIQEWIGYTGITRIDGSYFNVMGLPIQRLYEELINFEL